MNFRLTYAVPIIAAVVIAGCGQSAEEKARNQVCDARADIQKQVTTLKQMSVATVSKDTVRSSLTAIQADVQKIVDAQPNLNKARKADVNAANEQFKSQISSASDQLTKDLSLSGAKEQLKSALTTLGDSYVQALGQVNCN